MNPFNNDYINLPPELLVLIGAVVVTGITVAIISSINRNVPISTVIEEFFDDI